MFSQLKIGMLCLSLGAGASLVGCQSNGNASMPASHTMAGDAVACDKCEMTWVKTAVMGWEGGRKHTGVTGYSMRKKMECPDCKTAVANFFSTGDLKHDCKACGGNMVVCEKH